MYTFFLMGIAVITNFFVDKKKIVKWINFLFMWILFGWSYGATDTMIQIERYIYPHKFHEWTEIGMNSIIKLFRVLRYDYRFFMVIISGIALFILINFIDKYSDFPGLVYNLFYLFPMGYVFCQLRFFFAFSIVLVAITFLIHKKKYYEVYFILLILVASCFHYSAVFFSIYLLCDKLSSMKKVTILTILLSFFSFWIVMPFLNLLSRIPFLYQKLSNVINGQQTKGNYKYIGMYIGLFLIFVFMYWIITKDEKRYGTIEKVSEMQYFVCSMNVINLVSIPLMIVFSTYFLRIIMYMQIINYIFFANYLSKRNAGNRRNKLVVFLLLYICLIILCKVMFWDETFKQRTIIPLFWENKFLK